jgi:hypothetical protein
MTKVIRAIDTLDYKQDGAENLAQHEDVLVGWRGRWVKLDLSHEHFTAIDQMMSPLMTYGDPVEKEDKPKPGRTPKGHKSYAHGGRRPAAYYEGLIEWVDANHITKKDGSGRPAYAGVREGRHDYPDWLIRDYDAYLEKAGKASAA